MSLDYPNRDEWLAKRNNHVAGKRVYGRMRRVMPESGKNKDPGQIDAHRRMRGPLVRAVGPGSYDEWKQQLAAQRTAKRTAKRVSTCLR